MKEAEDLCYKSVPLKVRPLWLPSAKSFFKKWFLMLMLMFLEHLSPQFYWTFTLKQYISFTPWFVTFLCQAKVMDWILPVYHGEMILKSYLEEIFLFYLVNPLFKRVKKWARNNSEKQFFKPTKYEHIEPIGLFPLPSRYRRPAQSHGGSG